MKRKSFSAAARSAAPSVDSNQLLGTVTDESGEGLPGVNVLVKGTTTGTQTDMDGQFELEKDTDQTLVFSYVGFETQEVEVSNQDEIEVVMGGSADLQEVVVTGYARRDGAEDNYTPALPGNGRKAYTEYLEEALMYPASAQENGIEGTVVLQLSISTSGSIEDISIRRSLGYGCDEEAIRLVREGPEWTPANRNGSAVEDQVRVKVKFRL